MRQKEGLDDLVLRTSQRCDTCSSSAPKQSCLLNVQQATKVNFKGPWNWSSRHRGQWMWRWGESWCSPALRNMSNRRVRVGWRTLGLDPSLRESYAAQKKAEVRVRRGSRFQLVYWSSKQISSCARACQHHEGSQAGKQASYQPAKTGGLQCLSFPNAGRIE